MVQGDSLTTFVLTSVWDNFLSNFFVRTVGTVLRSTSTSTSGIVVERARANTHTHESTHSCRHVNWACGKSSISKSPTSFKPPPTFHALRQMRTFAIAHIGRYVARTRKECLRYETAGLFPQTPICLISFHNTSSLQDREVSDKLEAVPFTYCTTHHSLPH